MEQTNFASVNENRFWQRLRALAWLVRYKPREAWLVVRLCFWVVVVTYLVPRLSLPRLLGWLSPRRRGAHYQPRLAPQRAAFWLDRLLQTKVWVFTPVCWKRALVLHRVLGREGIETRVLFGIRQDSSHPLDGHAWLECEGRPLLEKEPPDYVVTFAHPSDERSSRWRS